MLKESLPVLAGEVVDATFMSRSALQAFLAEQVQAAKADGVLFSVHLKATMMKVSDPILFGKVIEAFFPDVFDRFSGQLDAAGADVNNGFGDVLAAVATLDDATRAEVEAAIDAAYESGPDLAMVNSHKGITNLHVPSDVIVDASMPAMIRVAGKMWNKDDQTQDTLAVIPDSSYAGVYQTVIEDCQANGAFDPRTMGTVPNVGLMAQKAEEYGSHDKTFEIAAAGDGPRRGLRRHRAAAPHRRGGRHLARLPDQGRADPRLGQAGRHPRPPEQHRRPSSGWMPPAPTTRRSSPRSSSTSPTHDTDGLEFHTLAPADACAFSLERIRRGKDTISVTGNVLRDYLTDLFPIMELGTSAKMLSIVPLMAGGGMYETGAGGSAPKHVQQLVEENYLRWDSLGEFLALAVSLEHLATATDTPRAQVLADTLDAATGRFLDENKSPSRKVGELDNRGSHFYLAMYWAQALAAQTADADLAARFAPVAEALAANEATIVDELNAVQGNAMDIGGYYQPDPARAAAAMRPSTTFNEILATLA